MDATRFPTADGRRAGAAAGRVARGRARAIALLVAPAILCVAAPALAGRPPLRDAPAVWEEDDRRTIPLPKERAPNLLRDGIDETLFLPLGRLFNPVRAARRVGALFGGDRVPPAANVNGLDEVPNSSWFTNRMGLHDLSPREVALGPAAADGPDRSGPWTVIRAKTEGKTPGFSVRDARGDVYVIKFDPPCCPGMSSAAGVITGRAFHAIGYNVPEDHVTTFRREDLVLGENVSITEPGGRKRAMNAADIDSILARVTPLPDGAWRALASRFLKGKPVGPFDWQGRRKDDSQDRVRHENRRELRAIKVFAAWLAHFDTKQHNTLDMYVEEGGRHFLRHYLIDFASSLGGGASKPFPAASFEHAVDIPASFGRAAALGFHEDDWRKLRRPEGLEEVGYYESEHFDPAEWKPLNPNAAFANLTDRDGYWAAKILSAFTDAHIEALVAEGRYRNPDAARWIAREMARRRDKIARHWFDRVAPLDFFVVARGALRFRDLGVERGLYAAEATRYRARSAGSDAGRRTGPWSAWRESEGTAVEVGALEGGAEERGAEGGAAEGGAQAQAATPFVAVEVQVARGGAWSDPVRVTVARASGRVVAVDR